MQLKFRQQLQVYVRIAFGQGFLHDQPAGADNVHQPLIRPQDGQAYNQDWQTFYQDQEADNEDQQFDYDLEGLRLLLGDPQGRQLLENALMLERLFGIIRRENQYSLLLTTITYQDVKDNLERNQCIVCLNPFDQDPNGELAHLHCCPNHILHKQCIKEWLKSNDG